MISNGKAGVKNNNNDKKNEPHICSFKETSSTTTVFSTKYEDLVLLGQSLSGPFRNRWRRLVFAPMPVSPSSTILTGKVSHESPDITVNHSDFSEKGKEQREKNMVQTLQHYVVVPSMSKTALGTSFTYN